MRRIKARVTFFLGVAGWMRGEGDAFRFHSHVGARRAPRSAAATFARATASMVLGNPSTTTWELLELAEDRRGPCVSGATAATLPDGRGGTYLFGGLSNSGVATNELWLFNEGDDELCGTIGGECGAGEGPGWQLVETAGTPPPPRMYSASVVADDNTLLIVGGWDPGAKGSGGTVCAA